MPEPTFAGIFLRNIQAESLVRVSSIFQDWQPNPMWRRFQSLDIQPAIVTKIIPYEMQEEANSWLIIYKANYPSEVFIIPYPEQLGNSYIADEEKLVAYTRELLYSIIGDRENSWFPSTGYVNLVRTANRRDRPTGILPRHFQIIRLRRPIYDVISDSGVRVFSVENAMLQQMIPDFIASNDLIQRSRENLIVSLLTINDQEEHSRLIEQHETITLEEIQKLSTRIPKITPPIIFQFNDIIDEETRSFLVSAETVAKYAIEHMSLDFDFSLPGCGLWKSLERELNSSIIWHLRHKKGIADFDRKPAPYVSDNNLMFPAGDKDLNLNQRQRGSYDFEDLSLGNVKYLLLSARNTHPANKTSIAGELMDVLDDTKLALFAIRQGVQDLGPMIGKVAYLRNGHAHVKRMNLSIYKELLSLVLEPYEKPEESLLGKVLLVKRQLKAYWLNGAKSNIA